MIGELQENTVEDALCSLMDMKLSDFDKSRNEILKMFVRVFVSNVSNNEKISFITKAVNQMVKTFVEANEADCVPPRDIEQVFGIKGDTEITDIRRIPVERAIVGVWQGILNKKNGLEATQIEEALFKGILPKIFKIAVEALFHKNEGNDCFRIVKENLEKIPWDHDMHRMINKLYSLHRTDVSQFHKEIDQGLIKIHFGFDKIHGFFFYVKDSRLQNQDKTLEEVNNICEEADVLGSGDGTYISLYTGEYGFGRKISIKAMKVFWTRYGVGEEFLEKIN